MKSLIMSFVVVFGLANLSPALGGDCNAKCRTYRSGYSYRLYPITADKFCVTFDQGVPDTVVLRLWHINDVDRIVLDADWLRLHVRDIGHVTYAPKARPFGPTGRYCFRRARVDDSNVLVELCNGSASAYLPPVELAGMLAQGLPATPRGLNLRGNTR